MESLRVEDKKMSTTRSSSKIPKKKTNQGKRNSNQVTPAGSKARDDIMINEEPVLGTINDLDDLPPLLEPDPAPEELPPGEGIAFGANSVSKKLKLEDMPVPSNSYMIENVVEKLQGGLNASYFKNPGKDGKEPYLPTFKSVFVDGVESELLIDGFGARCDSSHRFMPNKKSITDPSVMKFGWNLFLNDSVEHPGDWGIHLCNVLNGSDAYKNSFDSNRTQGRIPHFEVVHVLFPEESQQRKLDQVMMDAGIAKFLTKKYNLKNYGVRRRLKTDEDWNKLLEPYFEDVKRGRKVIDDHLAEQAGSNYFTP